jgi:hypothetical protein
MWSPTKISNGEPKFVCEVVVDRGRVKVVSPRKCCTDANGCSDKASKIASSDSLRTGTGLSDGGSVLRPEKLGLRRSYVTVLSDLASPLSVATKSLWISMAFKSFRLRYITIDCWSMEITVLDGSVLTSGEVKTDVVLVVC